MPDILSSEQVDALDLNEMNSQCRQYVSLLRGSHESLSAENERLTKELAEARAVIAQDHRMIAGLIASGSTPEDTATG